MRHAFQDLIDGLEVAHDEDGLVFAAEQAARRLGFRWFAYFASSGPSSIIVSSYPKAWVEHYRAQRFEQVDPVVRPTLAPRRSFYWSGISSDWKTPAQQRFFAEARSFQISSGVTVPIRAGGHSFAAFTLASDRKSDGFRRYAAEAIDILQLMGLYYHVHVHAKLRLGFDRLDDAPLTSRETQCLTWAARGKTMTDTAQILGVAKRTVEFHLDNARTKLNAATLPQAVAEAIRRDLLPRS